MSSLYLQKQNRFTRLIITDKLAKRRISERVHGQIEYKELISSLSQNRISSPLSIFNNK